jgi:hypothetical protein
VRPLLRIMRDTLRIGGTGFEAPVAVVSTEFEEKRARVNNFAVVAAAISTVYSIAYLSFPSLPGNRIEHPLGWLSWWDQSRYYASAKAFSSWNLVPSEHWYPFGYDLLVAPFASVMRQHAFFLPDLGCLLITSWLFLRMSERYGLPRWAQLLTLAIGLCPSLFVFLQYVIPWNTTLTAALLTSISYVYMRIVDRGLLTSNGPILAALTGSLIFTRPSDCLALVPIATHVAVVGLKRGNIKAIAASVAAFVATFGAGLWLYLAIYGWQKSEYMLGMETMGLPIETIPLKAYEMFVSPTEFFGGGIGIIPFMPWVVIGLIGLFYTIFSQPRFCAINITVVLFICIYLAFPDLWPGNIWYNKCIHYFVWPLLMCALFGAVMLRDIWRSPSILRLAAVLIPVIAVAAFKYARVDIPIEDLRRTDNMLAVRLAAPSRINGGHVSASISPDDSRDLGHYVEVDGNRLQNIYDYHIATSKDGFYFVFNRPQVGETISVSAPANVSFGANARITPFSGAIELRTLSDWKGAADRFMPGGALRSFFDQQ